MKKVRLGIIGLGNMGASHADKLVNEKAVPDIEVTAVCDIKESRRNWAKEHLGEQIPVFDDAEMMMDSGLCDAVAVAVPHYDHPTYAIMSMKKGLHVIIEKPAGVYTNQVLEMIAEADRHKDLVFAIMMNQRTNCVYKKVRELVQSGVIGEIRRTNWLITNWYRPQSYYDSGDWRATWSGEGGGVLLNQCPHNLDLWQWICGMPTKVTAHLQFGKWHDIEVEDDVTAFVEYANGATGCFITTTGDDPGTNRLEIDGNKGKIVTDSKTVELWTSEDGTTEEEFAATNKKPFGHRKFVRTVVETDGEYPKHMGVFKAFAGAILRGEPLIADGREGINGLTISNAMHLSAFTGKTVEVANFDHDLFEAELRKRIATSRRKENVTETTVGDMSKTFGS